MNLPQFGLPDVPEVLEDGLDGVRVGYVRDPAVHHQLGHGEHVRVRQSPEVQVVLFLLF